jgi:hypothetical protein
LTRTLKTYSTGASFYNVWIYPTRPASTLQIALPD